MKKPPEDVDRFLDGLLAPEDDALARIHDRTKKAGLPAIAVSPLQGAFLNILAGAVGARRILEVGSLGGYSTVWLARALPPEGVLVALDIDPVSIAAVRDSAEDAGLGGVIRLIEGAAAASMQAMVDSVEPAFDLIFIDADKTGYPRYLELSIALARPGSLIIADNVVREGAVADLGSPNENAIGVRRYLEAAARSPRLSTTVLQTVGAKGHDGFAISLVK